MTGCLIALLPFTQSIPFEKLFFLVRINTFLTVFSFLNNLNDAPSINHEFCQINPPALMKTMLSNSQGSCCRWCIHASLCNHLIKHGVKSFYISLQESFMKKKKHLHTEMFYGCLSWTDPALSVGLSRPAGTACTSGKLAAKLIPSPSPSTASSQHVAFTK